MKKSPAAQEGPQVLLVSKPMIPPWDDSGKVVVRSQLLFAKRYLYRILVPHGTSPLSAAEIGQRAICEPVYSSGGGYAPTRLENARVFFYGLRPRGAALYHYFFAPNPITSLAGRTQKLLARVPTVQTICSAPVSFKKTAQQLIGDAVIVLSDDTRCQLTAAGVSPGRLRLVRPGIAPIDAPSNEQRREIRRTYDLPQDDPVVVFPGDLEFSRAARTAAGAVRLLLRKYKDLSFVFACRIKTARSRTIKNELQNELLAAGLGSNIKFLERIGDMPRFIGCADVVVLPAESLYAKMDAPLVLLEAMAQGVPLVLANEGPLAELVQTGAALGIPSGSSEGLADAVCRILDDASLSGELGQRGRTAVQDHFSAEQMTQRIENIYDEVL